ncbi:hypothetical protein JQS43_24730 [Natronosporangium hydrolyticum]|uniref:Uncharacterized protein n=1 Tax=Natronosporangium hydrolyticum TaxID=2811111 RepID=A0A895YKK4_9ACTN|nr:hypothetical protein [Natronosporangium hydrolyticum]QSB14630.1 hypothetical protein JQS43_24730 [Natronosporangium hydrolyticum]
MTVDRLPHDIRHHLTRMFGSTPEPDYRLLREALASGPYQELIAALAARFTVDEDTDPNFDHGRCLLLQDDPQLWALDLSAVGPFAAFGRVELGWTRVIEPGQPDLDAAEQWVIAQLAAHDLRLLDRDVLELPVPLRLAHAADPRVYQALFSDTDLLPWDEEALGRLGLL